MLQGAGDARVGRFDLRAYAGLGLHQVLPVWLSGSTDFFDSSGKALDYWFLVQENQPAFTRGGRRGDGRERKARGEYRYQ
jgi:hypothetical protein